MPVDLKLKKMPSFHSWNKIPSDFHSCLFCAITSKMEETIGSHVAWTEAFQWSVTSHKKSNKTVFIVWISLKMTICKLRICFILKVTCSFMSVGTLAVYSLLCDVFFTVWEHVAWERHGLSNVATVTKGVGFLRMANCMEKSNPHTLQNIFFLFYKKTILKRRK